ncbi:MAG: TIGR02996 domain-containing protein [Gemmataceae bacterium]|nr:TIGR02996 domain-containing protein [Gemmataceae bacterium]
MDASDILLADILADPGDDLPRRVYADWCEDHGDSDRAEFIRLQLALAAMPDDDPARPEAEARETRLRKANERRWLGPLRGHVQGWGFRRGFVDSLAMHPGDVLAARELLERTVPLDKLALVRCGERIILDRLAELPLLERLRSLDLSGNILDREDAEGLLASPRLEGLRELRFNDNPYGFDAVEAVARSRTLGGLEVLELRRSNLTDGPASRLCESACLSGLRVLDLRGNAIGEGGRREVRRFFGDAARF